MKNGTVTGPIVLRGHGDPSLETKDLWDLARDLRHHLEAVHAAPAAQPASAETERSTALISQLVAIEARAEQLAQEFSAWVRRPDVGVVGAL